MSGYAAMKRQRQLDALKQRKCQRKGCDQTLQANAPARQKYCSERCCKAAYDQQRPKRCQKHRKAYNTAYVSRRRAEKKAREVQ